MERLAPCLPDEIVSQPPERFARRIEAIVRMYVSSLEALKTMLRTL